MSNSKLNNLPLGAPSIIRGTMPQELYNLSVQIASRLEEIILHDTSQTATGETFTLIDPEIRWRDLRDGYYEAETLDDLAHGYGPQQSGVFELWAKKNNEGDPYTLVDNVSWILQERLGTGTFKLEKHTGKFVANGPVKISLQAMLFGQVLGEITQQPFVWGSVFDSENS